MPTILDHPLTSPKAWRAETLFENDGHVSVSPGVQAELERIGAELAANPLPLEMLRVDDFGMPASQALMADVRAQVEDGIGFAVIDRLDLDPFDVDTAKKLYWLLMQMLGPPVAQKWDGTMIYDVTDTGARTGAGSGVRSSKTNRPQRYHTDNAFNLPPDFVALLCLRPAKEGGVSGLVSFEAVYNRLLSEHPDLVPRLYEPFYYDRQNEHAPGAERVSFKPILEAHGDAIKVAFSPTLVRQGYQVAGVEMDATTKAALDAFISVTEDSRFSKSFDFARGQIQVVNNRQLGHRRTGFVDWPNADQRRHLVRIWVRKTGRPFYSG